MKYFEEILKKTGTEFWCNNPYSTEINLARENGMAGITTNPGYFNVLEKSEDEYLGNAIRICLAARESLKKSYSIKKDSTNNFVLDVMKYLVVRPLRVFHPSYVKSRGSYGYVAIQGDPFRNHDLESILKEAQEFKSLGENIIIKVPSSREGSQALEILTREGYPTICTMCFSVSQFVIMAEAYQKGLKTLKTRKWPVCYITMLPGILSDYLVNKARENKTDISLEIIDRAGIYTLKAAYKIYKKQKYGARIISGGARRLVHFTSLIGNNLAHTISWEMAAIFMDSYRVQDVRKETVKEPENGETIDMLQKEFPDFKKAVEIDGLDLEKISQYGPFIEFQEKFRKSYLMMQEKVKKYL